MQMGKSANIENMNFRTRDSLILGPRKLGAFIVLKKSHPFLYSSVVFPQLQNCAIFYTKML